MDARITRLGVPAVALAGVCACAVAVIVTASAIATASGSVSGHVALETVTRALMVGIPIAVGLFARSSPASGRFGDVLILAGFGWLLATLSASADDLPYSVGRVSTWLFEAALVYVLLAFPSGRLPAAADRALVWAAVLLFASLYLPTAPLVEQYPLPAPLAACGSACPDNAFTLVQNEPAWVDALILPLREALLLALFAGVTLRLVHRIRGATLLARRLLAPVLVVAMLLLAALAVGLLGRRLAPESRIVEGSLWLIALALPIVAGALLWDVWRWRLFIATALHRLTVRLHAHPEPEQLRASLASAFDDPSLELVSWLDGGQGRWVDAAGHPVSPPVPNAERAVTEVRDGERRVAAIIHDAALRHEHAFTDAATAYAFVALDNHRLTAQTAALVREVQESRKRIQASADDERRRIEQNLHDGAQQRLVELRVRLQLAAECTGDGNSHYPELLRGLGAEVDEALDEVRSLARGVYPAPLTDRGLAEALRAAALRSALPTTVLAGAIRRYSRQVESAAYFCCLEALQNAAKHAREATGVVVELSDNGALHFEVRDDGAGFDSERVAAGMGFSGMRDRIAAVGGELAVHSRPGRGTRVTASIPLHDHAAGHVTTRGIAA